MTNIGEHRQLLIEAIKYAQTHPQASPQNTADCIIYVFALANINTRSRDSEA